MNRRENTIIISNIAVDVSESELKQLFSSPGKPISFEIDHNVNRRALCEYASVTVVQAAINQFNGFHLHGKALSVTPYEKQSQHGKQHQPVIGSGVHGQTADKSQLFSRVQQGAQTSINDQQIRNIILSLSEKEQAEVLCEFRTLVASHPEQMRSLLADSPQFAHAVLILMTMYQFVDQDIITEYQLRSQMSNEDLAVLEAWRSWPEQKKVQFRELLQQPLSDFQATIKSGSNKQLAIQLSILYKLQQRGIKL